MPGRQEQAESFELRLERVKHLGNLKLELLKFVYDGRPIAEKYADRDITLHVHRLAGEDCFCATWSGSDVDRASYNCMVPVFVGIRKFPEDPRPLASIERL